MLKLVKDEGSLAESLKIVILDCAYDQWNDPTVQGLFSKIVGLKLAGYGAEYPYGVMPIDTYDFIATHLALCEQRGDELFPVMAYKSVNWSRCKVHQLPFPGKVLLQSSGAEPHQKALTAILEECDRAGTEVSYDSSWTIAPEIRKDKPRVRLLREIMTALQVRYHQEVGAPEIVGCGVLRFKTQEYFRSLGYEPLRLATGELPSFKQASLFGEPVMMLHWKNFTEEALRVAKVHDGVWQRRVHLESPVARERGLALRKAA